MVPVLQFTQPALLLAIAERRFCRGRRLGEAGNLA
jgi:hypothetical protein